jgi:drug/metabolite transporter (DMT)-like permease
VAAAQGKGCAAAVVAGGARKAGEIELWIPITIAAAFLQNLRSMLQKHLKGRLSTGGATYARFIYAVPFAVAYVAGLAAAPGFTLPTPHTSFALYTVTGGLAQIVATALLIYLFSFRNFAVGTTYSKTETVQTAIFGLVILGDQLSGAAMVAILVSLVGVVALSSSQSSVGLGRLLTAWTERTALIGLASGAAFGISAVSYRAAALSLGGEGVLIQAAYTLACVLCFQTLVMGGYLLWGRRHARLGRLVHRHDPAERGLRAGPGPDRAGVHLPRRPPDLPRKLDPPRGDRSPADYRWNPDPAAGIRASY